MIRRNQILSGLLVVQLVLAGLVFAPRLLPSNTAGTPLYPNLKTDDIVDVKIQDNTGNSLELSKQNGAWVVPAAANYPVDDSKLSPFLDKLVGLTTGAVVARSESSYPQLQVADTAYVRKVDFKLADGSSHSLLIGSSPGAGSSHVRADGQAEVYIARNLSSSEASTDITGWVDTTYFAYDPTRVGSFKLQNANGSWEFSKDANGQWTLKDLAAGEQFNPDSVTSLVARMSSVTLSNPLGKEAKPEYGLSTPSAVMAITINDTISNTSRTLTLNVGARSTQDDTYVISSSDSPYFVRVSSLQVEPIVSATRATFLVVPTPAPTLEATPAVTTTEPITTTDTPTPQP